MKNYSHLTRCFSRYIFSGLPLQAVLIVSNCVITRLFEDEVVRGYIAYVMIDSDGSHRLGKSNHTCNILSRYTSVVANHVVETSIVSGPCSCGRMHVPLQWTL